MKIEKEDLLRVTCALLASGHYTAEENEIPCFLVSSNGIHWQKLGCRSMYSCRAVQDAFDICNEINYETIEDTE